MDRPGSARRRPSAHRTSRLVILYEDDDLIAVDKPAGLLTVPLPRKGDAPSVVEYLEDHLRSHQRRRPFVVHRIDRDTSGIVVVAALDAHAVLKGQFCAGARAVPGRRVWVSLAAVAS
jgi:23S rRNA-/tRNA-specific pseudouridylate synthase